MYPRVITAAQASYLKDGDIVFGVAINGDARAYPRRVLAWHEMARDRVGGVEITVVYCTLCGTVLPYEAGDVRFAARFSSDSVIAQLDGRLWTVGEEWLALNDGPRACGARRRRTSSVAEVSILQ